MNQYYFLQRIQGPALLLTFGIAALLNEWDILSFGRSWPLYLIVLGVLKLAQRAALAHAEPPPGYPGYQPATYGAQASSAPSTALVPTDSGTNGPTNEFGDRR
jgi:hypothetical protein